MKKNKVLVIPTSKPRNFLVPLVKMKNNSGLHTVKSKQIVTKGQFKNQLRKGIYD